MLMMVLENLACNSGVAVLPLLFSRCIRLAGALRICEQWRPHGWWKIALVVGVASQAVEDVANTGSCTQTARRRKCTAKKSTLRYTRVAASWTSTTDATHTMPALSVLRTKGGLTLRGDVCDGRILFGTHVVKPERRQECTHDLLFFVLFFMRSCIKTLNCSTTLHALHVVEQGVPGQGLADAGRLWGGAAKRPRPRSAIF
jgi:hypothetical protein